MFQSESSIDRPEGFEIHPDLPVIDIINTLKEGDCFTVEFRMVYCRVTNELKHQGVGTFIVSDDICGQGQWDDGVLDGEIIIGDVTKKQLLGVFRLSKGTIQSVSRPQVGTSVIDLNVQGARYEGEIDLSTNIPYGWGSFYDENDHIIYEGFVVGDRFVVYGNRYWDIDTIAYSGMLVDGVICGKGIEYDRNGQVDMDQDSVLHEHPIPEFTIDNTISLFSPLVNKLMIKSYAFCYATKCDFRIFPYLTVLIIQQGVLYDPLSSFTLSSMPYLKEFIVSDQDPAFNYCFDKHERFYPHRVLGVFSVKDCPSLERVLIGKHTFQRFYSCEITSMIVQLITVFLTITIIYHPSSSSYYPTYS